VIIPTSLLCQMRANSSGAEFLSTISKFMKKMNFVIACLLPSQNLKLGIFTSNRAVDGKEKSMMHVESCCFALSSYCLFDFLVAATSQTSYYLFSNSRMVKIHTTEPQYPRRFIVLIRSTETTRFTQKSICQKGAPAIQYSGSFTKSYGASSFTLTY